MCYIREWIAEEDDWLITMPCSGTITTQHVNKVYSELQKDASIASAAGVNNT